MRMKLRVMPAEEVPADAAAIMNQAAEEPVFRSGGEINYVCGSCGHVLIASANFGQFRKLFIKCFRCGAVNGTD